jgi:hypothetical protein
MISMDPSRATAGADVSVRRLSNWVTLPISPALVNPDFVG